MLNEKYIVVASKKPTSMSSIYDQTQLSENAVDGVVVCPTSRHYLTHTRREHNPWFKIDLQQMFDIMSVLMYARQDCCGTSQKYCNEITVAS